MRAATAYEQMRSNWQQADQQLSDAHIRIAAIEALCQQQHEALLAVFGFFDSGEFVRNTSLDSEEGWHLKMISIFKSLSDGQAALNAYAALFSKTGGAK